MDFKEIFASSFRWKTGEPIVHNYITTKANKQVYHISYRTFTVNPYMSPYHMYGVICDERKIHIHKQINTRSEIKKNCIPCSNNEQVQSNVRTGLMKRQYCF